ncbi:hypothetical protein [Moorena producens]|uniref:hypothetical protein n=1 Tax=Moorena producens TaxID=1155739 RepID=UPI003C70BE9D
MARWPSPQTPRAISACPLSTLPIPDSRFPTPYSLLPTPYSLEQKWCVTGPIVLSYRENQGSPVPKAPLATGCIC